MDKKPVFRQDDHNNLEFVRRVILYRLKHDTEWHQFDHTWYETGFVEFDPPDLRDRFVALKNEIMWQLLMQGVISPGLGLDAHNLNLPFFHITDYGKKVLEAERFIPHDAAGYLEDLRSVTGIIDTDVAIVYIEEALNCFNSGCHVASVLLLGVAAESVFNHMCDIVQASLRNENEKKKLNLQLNVKTRHRWIVQKYQSLPKNVQQELPESLDITLVSLYDLVRRQRNELGHPQDKPPKLSREQALIFFQSFPQFVSDAQAFAKYCQENGI